MAKSKNEVRGSYVTDKCINLIDNKATVPSPTRETPTDLSSFNQAYQKAEMVFRSSGGHVVGPFTLPNPVETKDFKLAHFICNDQLLQR